MDPGLVRRFRPGRQREPAPERRCRRPSLARLRGRPANRSRLLVLAARFLLAPASPSRCTRTSAAWSGWTWRRSRCRRCGSGRPRSIDEILTFEAPFSLRTSTDAPCAGTTVASGQKRSGSTPLMCAGGRSRAPTPSTTPCACARSTTSSSTGAWSALVTTHGRRVIPVRWARPYRRGVRSRPSCEAAPRTTARASAARSRPRPMAPRPGLLWPCSYVRLAAIHPEPGGRGPCRAPCRF